MIGTCTPLSAQRGAGMLMATVFLLIVIALFGLIGLRMASTDITDTALQNDSVEALFLAESGLERAAQRLAAGTTCDVTLTEAAQTLGRGTFQLQSASLLPSGLCRVQVLGSVGLAGATPATRLIEADLSLGGCRGFAVGDRINSGPAAQRGAVLLCWDGTTWTRSAFAGLPNANLTSVTCPAANDCWAVGATSGGVNILHWDGTAWTRVPPAGLPNRALSGVHCFDTNTCWAVGSNRTFLRWNTATSTWSAGTTAPGFPNAQMNKVFCIAALDCWAVGNASGGNAVIAHWIGGNWTRVIDPDVPNRNLLGITCTSGMNCWAVGAQTTGPNADNFNQWNGATWLHPSPYPLVPNVPLNGVHCSAADNCWAVGNTSGGAEVIARWNAATSLWTRITYPINNRVLYGVFMVGALEGYVVGVSGQIGVWNGVTWANQASPVTIPTLRAVAMAPSGGGTVAVQRWREIIPP